jgi:alpha-glucosidase (family GH31 glycosyl hydrolase)
MKMKNLFALLLLSLIFAFTENTPAKIQTSQIPGKYEIVLDGSNIVIKNNKKSVVVISSIEFNFTKPTSISLKEIAPDKYSMELKYPSEAKYKEEGYPLNADVEISIRNNSIRFYSNPKWSEHVTINMANNGEHFFGILEPLYPDNKMSPDLRGEVVDVDIEGNANQYRENYSDVWSAFYMTNIGYASFFDTFAKGKYKLGINNEISLYHRTGVLDWYIIFGENGDKILKEYYEIIGRPKFVPMWAVGPVAWRDENKGGKEEILSDIKKMTELQIPFTAWWVDRPYSNGASEWSKMDFNSKFSNPKEWIGEINNKYGIQFMTWVGPMTFDDKDFPGLLPNFRGYMDLTNPDAVKEFGRRLEENQYNVGVKGHKMDRAEEEFPEMSPWFDKTPEAERRNKYIFLYAKTIDGFLKQKFDKDEFNFARGAFQRCQPYLSAVWGGDSRSSWDGLRGSLANSIRVGFMGFPVWGSDGGGYLGGRISEDLYARWVEFASWCGLCEIKLDNAGGKGEDRPPWKYSDKLINIFRDCANFRMDMEPFLYSIINTSYKNGVAMKPLAYQFPEDKLTFEIWNEYMLGNTFLVAPITDSSNTRKIYLPRGKWYDFYNRSKVYQGGSEITMTVPLDHIPVFVKNNSFYVTGKMLDGNSKLWSSGEKENKLNIYAFPGEPGDTVIFNYVDYTDNSIEKNFIMTKKGDIIKIATPKLLNDAVYVIRADEGAKGVMVNDQRIKWDWDNSYRTVNFRLKKGKGYDIQISVNSKE